ncbi:MAG: methionine adenosyltransferase [Patescibacteria group bacterium]|nr:methionine adenosyltransferase [Patescibacteria group bacterium]MDD4304322.1 methionine adenosyltransferase [Patescibacteria group bacterium]MDD4695585.1 methionine adenosyltransferase [Patescibacteria group bacterium]
MTKYFFTSESVTEGHPDKICDQISDKVLDTILEQDPHGHCCCESFTTTGLVLVGGEITTNIYVDIRKIVRDTLKEIGYNNPNYGIDYQSCSVLTAIDPQSPDIAQGEDENQGDHKSMGAGDQGMMFGYACNETPELMPLPITLAHRLTKKLAEVRKNGTLAYLRPDGKSQVTVEYEDGKPKSVNTVVVAAQHNPDVDLTKLRADIVEHVIKPILGEYFVEDTKILINETGRFVSGGPAADTGLTGRKIIVDSYGGMGRHGGGCFSGKSPNKQDRSGAYMARYVAKNVVAAGLADRVEIEISYAIGYPEPVSIMVNTFGTSKLSDEELEQIVKKHFDFTPSGIINNLDLLRPIYAQTATYGHFGRNDLNLPWEKLDKVNELKQYIK